MSSMDMNNDSLEFNNSLSLQLQSEAFYKCQEILIDKGFIMDQPVKPSSDNAIQLGKEMADSIIQLISNLRLVEEDELFTADEVEIENVEQQESNPTSNSATDSSQQSSQSQSDYEPPEKKSRTHVIPLEKKIKILNLQIEHPNWSFKTLKTYAGPYLARKDELNRWRKQVATGGTKFDKSSIIKNWTFDRFKEARLENKPVQTRHLQEWALQGAMQFRPDYNFNASQSWVNNFKKEYRICQRKVTKYVKKSNKKSLEDIEIAAACFQEEIRSLLPTFSKDMIINTDQMGCEYRANVQRTLGTVGQKTVEVYLGDINKVTHTYTAQYSITASGKLLPQVFLCLQEATGNFGPRIQVQINNLMAEYKNVFITASKSGKLSKELFDTYTEHILQSYVQENRFLLVLDSWSGQSQPELFDKFKNESGESICTVKYIPPSCTSFCQPLDTYLHRQIKYFIKRLQNCTYLMEQQRQINRREDAIKIHSIIHNQLTSPLFKNMIEYSWFTARLISDRDVFMNVKEVCFSQKSGAKCACEKISLLKCSWCRENLCFECFYELYHPKQCTKYFKNV